MGLLTIVQTTARTAAEKLGRDSWIVQRLRPAYALGLDLAGRGRGIPWTINGEVYRIDPRQRHRMGASYDAAVARFLRERVKPGAVCVDVGANVGVYVLQFARWAGPTGRVIAFEPNPVARAVLEQHVAMNDIAARTEVVPRAVGASAGDAVLYASDADGMSRLGAPNAALGARVREIPVPVVTIDDYLGSGADSVDWLLIDIEGFEFAALAGARRLIERRAGALGIVVEIHPSVWPSANTDRASAERLLRELRLRPVALTGQRDPLAEHGLVHLDYEASDA